MKKLNFAFEYKYSNAKVRCSPEVCPDCGSNHTRTDWLFNFHKCEDCSAMWKINEIDLEQNVEADNEGFKALESYSLKQLEDF